MARWVVSLFMFCSLALLLLVLVTGVAIDSDPSDNTVYACRVYGDPATSCTLGTQNCASYSKQKFADWSSAFYADKDSDADFYYASCGQDCDDTNGAVHPLASEVCGNGVDENCDGYDETCPFTASLVATVSGTTVTLTVTTNYGASCCFDDVSHADYDACDGDGGKIGTLTTDTSGQATRQVTQNAGTTKTYHVYCRTPP